MDMPTWLLVVVRMKSWARSSQRAGDVPDDSILGSGACDSVIFSREIIFRELAHRHDPLFPAVAEREDEYAYLLSGVRGLLSEYVQISTRMP